MSTSGASHGRTQTLLLISKLLDCRDNASPLTLITDSAEQTAKPLLNEYTTRAVKSETIVTFVSFETLVAPPNIQHFIRAWDLPLPTLTSQIHFTTSNPGCHLLIFDTLYPLLSDPSINITSFLPPLIKPSTTLLAVHRADQPLPPSPPYSPGPFQLLHYLATTVLTVHSLPHILDQQRARQRSLAAPAFGVHEEEEGVLQGLGSCDPRVCVVEMEHRRKSGRAVGALFVVDRGVPKAKETVRLLDETTAWRSVVSEAGGKQAAQLVAEEQGVSFNLGLTDKQKRDREGVVLPYYDAQSGEGSGEGGRILYDMGSEDDFDEEEDEI